ncbi:MAG: hypothetical protein NTZ68_03380 [Candidatus Dependentiae bacterium]|nr:hypothetical protein [Candidatus Dependentiae bacterium]
MLKKTLLCSMLIGLSNFVSGMETQQEKQLRENRTREKLLEKIVKALGDKQRTDDDEQRKKTQLSEQKKPESK